MQSVVALFLIALFSYVVQASLSDSDIMSGYRDLHQDQGHQGNFLAGHHAQQVYDDEHRDRFMLDRRNHDKPGYINHFMRYFRDHVMSDNRDFNQRGYKHHSIPGHIWPWLLKNIMTVYRDRGMNDCRDHVQEVSKENTILLILLRPGLLDPWPQDSYPNLVIPDNQNRIEVKSSYTFHILPDREHVMAGNKEHDREGFKDDIQKGNSASSDDRTTEKSVLPTVMDDP